MRENRQLEFKELVHNYKDITKELVAFLNDIGGELLIGLDDQGKVLGLDEGLLEKYLEELPVAIFDGISPYCNPNICVKNIEDKQIISIQVFPGNRKPYFLKSKGIPKGVYIRVGSHSVPATQEIIEDLQRSNTKESFDGTIVENVKLEELDKQQLKRHYGVIPTEQQMIADHVIQFDPVTKQLSPTVTGVLFFHKKPREILSGAEILFSRFSGEDMKSLIKTKDYSAPLVTMVTEVIEDIKNEIPLDLKRSGVILKPSKYAVPEIVLREVIVNALIHRKYFIQDAIKIALFQNRLEVYSPGNFPGPLTDFLSGTSYSRNPHIRQLARNIGLVEKRGLGFRIIFEECKLNNNPPPKIIEQLGDFVKVIIFFSEEEQTVANKASKKRINFLPDNLLKLEELYLERRAFTLKEVAELLACSKNTAQTRLQVLIDKKIIKRIGEGRATHFIWL